MKVLASLCLVVGLSFVMGCGGEPGTADVEGKPALKADPNADKGGPGGGGGGMSMKVDPTVMMMGRLDKNRDGKITKDEYPEGGAEEMAKYDADSDGTVTKEEMDKYHKSVKGLGDLASSPDENKKVKK